MLTKQIALRSSTSYCEVAHKAGGTLWANSGRVALSHPFPWVFLSPNLPRTSILRNQHELPTKAQLTSFLWFLWFQTWEPDLNPSTAHKNDALPLQKTGQEVALPCSQQNSNNACLFLAYEALVVGTNDNSTAPSSFHSSGHLSSACPWAQVMEPAKLKLRQVGHYHIVNTQNMLSGKQKMVI